MLVGHLYILFGEIFIQILAVFKLAIRNTFPIKIQGVPCRVWEQVVNIKCVIQYKTLISMPLAAVPS